MLHILVMELINELRLETHKVMTLIDWILLLIMLLRFLWFDTRLLLQFLLICHLLMCHTAFMTWGRTALSLRKGFRLLLLLSPRLSLLEYFLEATLFSVSVLLLLLLSWVAQQVLGWWCHLKGVEGRLVIELRSWIRMQRLKRYELLLWSLLWLDWHELIHYQKLLVLLLLFISSLLVWTNLLLLMLLSLLFFFTMGIMIKLRLYSLWWLTIINTLQGN
jgi:hypothetical protein